jgi:hypothetical protein
LCVWLLEQAPSTSCQTSRRAKQNIQHMNKESLTKSPAYNNPVHCHTSAEVQQRQCEQRPAEPVGLSYSLPQQRLDFCATMTIANFGVSHHDTELQPVQQRTVLRHRIFAGRARLQTSAKTHAQTEAGQEQGAGDGDRNNIVQGETAQGRNATATAHDSPQEGALHTERHRGSMTLRPPSQLPGEGHLECAFRGTMQLKRSRRKTNPRRSMLVCCCRQQRCHKGLAVCRRQRGGARLSCGLQLLRPRRAWADSANAVRSGAGASSVDAADSSRAERHRAKRHAATGEAGTTVLSSCRCALRQTVDCQHMNDGG